MLVLTRKKDEAIRIGDDIVVKIISCEKHGVRIGIEAPGNVTILREELFLAVSEENKKASREASAQILDTLKEKLVKS